MPAERYFYPDLFALEQQIIIDGNEFHHLVNVMRNKVGAQVEVINGRQQLGYAIVSMIEKKRALLTIKEIYAEAKRHQRIILAQGIPRINRLEDIVEKGTELGMTELWLFPGVRSEKKELSENQLERLKIIMISAMKQCGRLSLPTVTLMPPLRQWKDWPSPAFFGDVRMEAPLFKNLLSSTSESSLFFIGPESGFTPEEIAYLEEHCALGVQLNKNILRTETAAIAALTLMSH